MLGESVFSVATKGTCLYCHRAETIIHAMDLSLPGTEPLGVCDVCAFALGHAWNRATGRHVVATTPRFSRTYVLVPKLPEGRPVEDISSYQFLTAPDGFLPWFEYGVDSSLLPELLEREYGCKTWSETLKRCYLGFASGGDFSEVMVAWAWGRSLFVKDVARSWKTFAELLATPTPESGFHLGVAAGFETLLWRKEVQPEGNELCVYLPARTMKYLRHFERQTDVEKTDKEDLDDEDDSATLDFYKSSMSPAELSVVALLENARRKREEEAEKVEEETSLVVEGDGVDESDDERVETRGVIIPPGFARPRTIIGK
jgi:hypothetical protein